MPRTRNVTRGQWDAAVSADPSASVIRSLSSTSSHHRKHTSRSSFVYGHTEEQERGSSLSIGSSKENYGYDDDEGANDENRDENTAPPVQGKGKGKEVATQGMSKKRPLQDITDIVATRSNRPPEPGNMPRRRRKRIRRTHDPTPLLPSSPSPAKKRTPARNVRFPSSLPPSSPPLPLPPSFEQPTSDSRQRYDVWQDAAPEEQEDLPLASDDTEPRRNSDPFGFFAVEKELKAERRYARAGPSTEVREAGGLILVPATSPLRLDLGAAVEVDKEDEMISPRATPQTPHKRKRKRRFNPFDGEKDNEALLFSPRTESLPSSPSPSKVREPWVKKHVAQDHSDLVRSTTGYSDGTLDDVVKADEGGETEESEKDDAGNETVTETTQRVLRSRAKGKEKQKGEPTPLPRRKTRRKREKESQSNTPSDPVEFARRLVKRLPKRRKKMKEEGTPDRDPKPRPAARKRKIQNKKVKDQIPPASRREFDEERLAIRDYFKQLDGYSLEEEKVYVI